MDIKRPAPIQKRPSNAKKVFSGVIFDVHQWEQVLYDGSKAKFETLARTDTVIVIPVAPDGRIYVSTQTQPGKPPFRSFFGGRVEAGEDPFTAVKRELLEESGLVSDDWYLLKSEQTASKIDYALYTFVARNSTQKSTTHLDPGEEIEVDLVSWEEFLEMVTSDDFNSEQEFSLYCLRKLYKGKGDELRREIMGT